MNNTKYGNYVLDFSSGNCFYVRRQRIYDALMLFKKYLKLFNSRLFILALALQFHWSLSTKMSKYMLRLFYKTTKYHRLTQWKNDIAGKEVRIWGSDMDESG